MMEIFLFLLALLFATTLVILMIWRQLDHRADRAEMARLIALQPKSPHIFDPAMVADLPSPARRYFEYTILKGTPLFTVADIEMTGQFSLGTKEAPNYMAMTARQVLAAPNGFIWKCLAAKGSCVCPGRIVQAGPGSGLQVSLLWHALERALITQVQHSAAI